MKKFAIVVGLLMMATVVLTACGGGGGGGEAQTVTVKALDTFAFEPKTIPVKPGKVTIVLDNSEATQMHDITIPSLNIQIVAQAGQKVEKTIEVKAGTVDFHCAQPGHEAGGMTGQLQVSN